jgi:hypothetical protein
MNPFKVQLFISRESAVYSFTRRQIEEACTKAWGPRHDEVLEVIDIEDNPDLAEEHNIEALPTLIIGGKRFIGMPTREMLATCLQLAESAKGKAASK